jgi:hypothetical protein
VHCKSPACPETFRATGSNGTPSEYRIAQKPRITAKMYQFACKGIKISDAASGSTWRFHEKTRTTKLQKEQL